MDHDNSLHIAADDDIGSEVAIDVLNNEYARYDTKKWQNLVGMVGDTGIEPVTSAM